MMNKKPAKPMAKAKPKAMAGYSKGGVAKGKPMGYAKGGMAKGVCPTCGMPKKKK